MASPAPQSLAASPRIQRESPRRPGQTEASSGRPRNRLECDFDAFPTLLVAPATDQRATGRAHLIPGGFVQQQPLEGARKRGGTPSRYELTVDAIPHEASSAVHLVGYDYREERRTLLRLRPATRVHIQPPDDDVRRGVHLRVVPAS